MEISYATVREYNLLREELPELTPIGTDLKDFQRPWVVKRILESYSTGKILEIGADRCELADYLQKKGFEVWVIDVYDSFAGGTATFEEVKRRFPKLNIHKGFLHEDKVLPTNSFDVICSCSVLEHVRFECIQPTIEKIYSCLKIGGFSVHAVDFIVEGNIMVNHQRMSEILRCHHSNVRAEEIQERALADVDTFYLSPQGHYRWRHSLKRSYDDYPYHRVTSLDIVAKRHA